MDSFQDFKNKLDLEHKWPCNYMFKFVVPSAKADEVRTVYRNETLIPKTSKAGNYVSFTMEKRINSSDEVVAIYQEAKQIEGLMVL